MQGTLLLTAQNMPPRNLLIVLAALQLAATMDMAMDADVLLLAPAWLRELEAPAITRELRQLADDDEGAPASASAFAGQFGPNTDLAKADGDDWQALPLMNKGQLLQAGCAKVPTTCAALSRLRGHLQPRDGASEVGVRVLKLGPGGRLRPHRGPGGRLVAHLGIKIPAGSFLSVAGQKLEWHEGGFTVFDDSAIHSAGNPSTYPRYILHVAYPADEQRAAGESGADEQNNTATAKVIGSTGTPHFRLDFFDDCGVVATSLRSGAISDHQPLVLLYNRVADNQPADFEPCVSAALLPTASEGDGSPSNGTLRITAAHGYGSVDISYYSGKDLWVVFEMADLSLWKADPVETHMIFTLMCPKDICPDGQGYPQPTAGKQMGKEVGGKFWGWRGAEGASASPLSSGFLTVSSDWEFGNSLYYAETGWKLAHTLAPTADLPSIWAGVAAAEGIPPPNKNRARTWLWTGATEASLDHVIKLAKDMGVELIFLEGVTSNIGDYKVNTKNFPSGLGAVRDRIHAAGLQVGMHMISGGATVCLDQMTLPWGLAGKNPTCRGNPEIDTAVSRDHPEVFVPQGMAPRDWYWANSAGTWYCHEQSGTVCSDLSKQSYLAAGPGHPIAAPPSNPIHLEGNVTWSKLGRFREGGAILLDGATAFGWVSHTAEYNFTTNEYYARAVSEFTVQLTVHPVGPTTGKVQTLVAKENEWALLINEEGKLEWHVHVLSGWLITTGTRVLKPVSEVAEAYVIKAS